MADLIVTETGGVHRPRNVDWKRAAALLYGDWGTSKAYVIGLAFLAAGFSSLPIILAVCVLTGLVGINYAVICRYFPDGGGVYSAARSQGRLLAVVGALLLIADLTVTAALSGWSGLSYFNIPILKEHIVWATVGMLLLMGVMNWYGPKHSGSFAVALAVPTVIVVVVLIAITAPHLTTRYLERPHDNPAQLWVQFVGVILALSGVEAIANLTGVMKLDPDSTPHQPKVAREAAKAIWPVAVEVVIGTALLGWAMLSLNPNATVMLSDGAHSMREALHLRSEDSLRFIGEQFGTQSFGALFGSCSFNRALPIKLRDRVLLGVSFVILFLVEITLAHTKPDALFFVCCVLGVGLALRAFTLKRSGITTLTVTRQVAEMVSPTLAASMQPRLEEGQRIMVAARGITPVLSYALDEAQLRKASLYVVFVKEIAVYYGAGPVR